MHIKQKNSIPYTVVKDTENLLGNHPAILQKPDTFELIDADLPASFQTLIYIPVEFESIRPMYMRLALYQAGYLTSIEAVLAQPGNEVQRIAFEYALEFKRDDVMINAFATAFGMTENQVNELFILAAQLQGES